MREGLCRDMVVVLLWTVAGCDAECDAGCVCLLGSKCRG